MNELSRHAGFKFRQNYEFNYCFTGTINVTFHFSLSFPVNSPGFNSL
jgi:hypothetical protein